jgi:hypothetical protein
MPTPPKDFTRDQSAEVGSPDNRPNRTVRRDAQGGISVSYVRIPGNAAIADATSTADCVTKFNTLLAELRDAKIIAT